MAAGEDCKISMAMQDRKMWAGDQSRGDRQIA